MTTVSLNHPAFIANCRPEFLQGFTDQGYPLDAVPYGVVGDHANLYANGDEWIVCVALMAAYLPDDEYKKFVYWAESQIMEDAK